MLKISCQCDDENTEPVDVYVRGLSFECGQPTPEDDFMITPLLTEAYAPTQAVVVSEMVFLTHAPTIMPLNGGIRINCPNLGTGSMSLDLYADGQKMTDAPIVMNTETKLVPKNVIKTLWQVLQPGVRLDVQVVSLTHPAVYPGFRGLQVCFLPRAQEDPS